jgi:ABC-type lipoprotein export system ATPase subunit
LSDVFIRIEKVARHYSGGVDALRDVDLEIDEGEFVAITGASGCGKSTLLHLLGALDTPTSGQLWVGDLALHEADDKRRTRYRRDGVGIVFQFFNLMPTMTVLENVALPLRLAGVTRGASKDRAGEMVEKVGLKERAGHFPHQLSGGEMQRAAIARALVGKPGLLLADEPTGNLDSENAALVLDLFREIHEQRLATMVIVTHSEEVAAAASSRVRMADGEVVI